MCTSKTTQHVDKNRPRILDQNLFGIGQALPLQGKAIFLGSFQFIRRRLSHRFSLFPVQEAYEEVMQWHQNLTERVIEHFLGRAWFNVTNVLKCTRKLRNGKVLAYCISRKRWRERDGGKGRPLVLRLSFIGKL